MIWKLADAKNRFTEVVNRALTEGPQEVTRRKDRVVILSKAEYDRLSGKATSLKQHLLEGPSLKGLDLERDRSGMREVDL